MKTPLWRSMTHGQRAHWRKRFNKVIRENDEIIIGKVTTKSIMNVMAVQGFWSGVYVRIYYKGGEFVVEDKKYGRVGS